MGKGKQTVTNITEFPDFIRDQMEETFDMAGDYKPDVFEGQRIADPSDATLASRDAMLNFGLNRPAYVDDSILNMIRLQGAETDTSGLNSVGALNPSGFNMGLTGNADVSKLNEIYGKNTNTTPLASQVGQANAATGLLGGIATQGSTNPALQAQIDDAVRGATNQATSQYSMGGRLGSAAFGDALGRGQTAAAAPILAQNMQAEQDRQLEAARALGAVSGQDLGRGADIGQALSGFSAGDLTRQAGVASDITSASAQDANRAAQQAQAQAQLNFNAQNADLNRGLKAADAIAGYSAGDLGRSLTASGMAPAFQQADMSRMGLGAAVGQDIDAYNQAQINADMGLLGDQNAAQQQVYNNMLAASGLAPNFGSNTQTTQGGMGNIMGGLGGAATGAALANAMSFSPYMGAGAGGLLGLIASDIRLKTNLKYLGKEQNGLKVYDWDWNKKAKELGLDVYPTRGYIAQEVKGKFPNAVVYGDDGFMRIDTSAIPAIEV